MNKALLQRASINESNNSHRIIRFLTTLDGEVRIQRVDGKIFIMDETTFRNRFLKKDGGDLSEG